MTKIKIRLVTACCMRRCVYIF